MTDFHKLKVVDLKKLLKDKNLPVAGTKPELIMRLEALEGTKATVIAQENTEGIDAEILLDEDTTVSSTITSVPIKTQPPKIEKITMAKPNDKGIEGRIKRFGAVSTEAQKTLRENRFNIGSLPAAKLNNNVNMEDALKKRAERFTSKTPTSNNVSVKLDSNDILAKRANRFGLTASPTAATAVTAVSSKESILTSSEAKNKRAERFKTNSSTPASKPLSVSTNNENSAILKRKGRFGVIIGPTDVSEEKKSKRAERFGLK